MNWLFIRRAFLAALATCSLSLQAANLITVTVEGPDVVDSQTVASVQMSAIAHWDDGTSTDVTSVSYWTTSNHAVAMANGGRVTFGALGTTTVLVQFGSIFGRDVTYVAGTPVPWVAPSLECPTEIAGPGLAGTLVNQWVAHFSELAPLCNGRVVLATTAFNRLRVYNIHSQGIEASIALPGTATRLRRVPGTSFLLARLSRDLVARVDLATGDWVARSLSPASAIDVAAGEPGQIMVLATKDSESWIYVLDSASLNVIHSQKLARLGDRIDYDLATHSLFLRGLPMVRYLYDTGSHQLAEVQAKLFEDVTAQALSADGTHLLVRGLDVVASDMNRRYGAWNADYIYDAAFRPDNGKVLRATASGLELLDVATHMNETRWQPASVCSGMDRVRFSPSGSLAYIRCGVTTDYLTLYSLELGPPTPPQVPMAIPPPGLAFDCASEDLGGLAPGFMRKITVGPADSILPACDGRVLVGNQANNRVETLDVRTNAIVGSSQLSASPLEIRRIPGTLAAIVRMDSTWVAKVDLSTGSVSYAPLENEVAAVSGGEPGEFFVSYLSEPFTARIATYDSTSMSRLAAQDVLLDLGPFSLVAYDGGTHRLFGARPGITGLRRFSYNPVSRQFTFSQMAQIGDNGQDLVLSPSGDRFIFPLAGADGISDIDPADLTHEFGRWFVGHFPRSGDFRNGFSQALLSNGSALFLADIASHAIQGRWELGGCESGNALRARYSPGGHYAYALADCLFSGATSTVVAVPLGPAVAPALPGPPLGLSVNEAGSGNVSFTFSPPSPNGSSLVLEYLIECGQGIFTSGTSSPILMGVIGGNAYTCTVSARNAAGYGPPSTPLTFVPSFDPRLLFARSVKQHGGAPTTFDNYVILDVPLGGDVSVEPRAEGAGHRIEFAFDVPITSPGTASVLDQGINPIGVATVSAAGNTAVIIVTGVPEGRRVLITLGNVNDSGANYAVALGFLPGDADRSRAVNSSDLAAVKLAAGQLADYANYNADVDASGAITAADILRVKGRVGATLP